MKDKKNEMKNVAIASGLYELTQRYGDAGGQFLVGLRGIDNQTGQVFDRSLLKISESKLNPNYVDQNIKQQAGYSAEVASVSKRNAQSIIDKSNSRFTRSEDLVKYGKNHNVVDIVELIDGKEITSQMKFVKNQEGLLKKIACGTGNSKKNLSRYLDVDKLEVPTEQVASMKNICQREADKLKEQANKLKSLGKNAEANKALDQAKNYEKLKGKISDSGLTTEKAIAYRLNPTWEVTKDIAKISHNAGLQGAKFGSAIGGTVSVISNVVAVTSGDKEFSEAVLDVSKDTLISGATGYGTAFTGTALKTVMSQSSGTMIRGLSKTNLPAIVVSTCISASQLIKRYANGEIDEAKLVEETGVMASGMLSSAMFATLGQIAIPIPILGGIIGGMIGYTITNSFHQNFLSVLNDAKLARENRILVEMQCAVSEMMAKEYQFKLNELFSYRLQQLDIHSQKLFSALNNQDLTADEFCTEINNFALHLGKSLPIRNMKELDEVMLSDEPLIF